MNSLAIALLHTLLVSAAARKGFDSVRSVHVYSVQKAKIKVSMKSSIFYAVLSVLQDSSSLFTANYDICKEHISTYSRFSLALPASE